jgi:predicted protein tyrosine phosphatase
MNLLFVCSKNQWRSPTGEAVFRSYEGIFTRSCGTSPNAKTRVSEKSLNWADHILVMEKKHKQMILERFDSSEIRSKIHVLDIPDDYPYMDAELIEILTTSVGAYLGLV